MLTIDTVYETTTEVNRSKFIAFMLPYSQFEAYREKLRKEHPKASHIVSAYRYLNAQDQIVESSSDDGEPKGCAGVPTLSVLRGNDLIDCAILTVRYFGGIKLGTGGMVRAYTLAAKNVITDAQLTEYRKSIAFEFKTSYSSVKKIEYLLERSGISEIEREFLPENISWKIVSDSDSIEKFRRTAGRLIS